MPIWILHSSVVRKRLRDVVDAASSGKADVVVERYGKVKLFSAKTT